MGDHSTVGNNHSSKKNGTATKSSKRTKLINKSDQNNLTLKYLGIRNYSFNKAGLNGDSIPTHEMSVADAVQSEVSRSNAFSYSNVSCLNNTASIMDQQFSRLLEFVQGTGEPQQTHNQGLKRMLQPMLCHLFLEMTKSRDGKLAGNFLKKYAPLVCPDIEDCDDAASPSVLANGNHDASSSNDNSSTTTITATSFKSLFKTLYGVTKKQDLDYLPDVIEFRTGSKFQLQLTSNELFMLKRYLSKYGHILILQILQSRFQIDVLSTEEDNSVAEEEETEDEVEKQIMDNKEVVSFKTEPVQNMVNGFVSAGKGTVPEVKVKKQYPKPASNKYYLDSLAEVVQRFNSFNLPINLHVLENATNVSSVSINKQATLIAGGFEESHILVWPVNQLPLPDQQHTRQPWSGRKADDTTQMRQEQLKEESPTCVHNELDPEVEYNGEALVVRGHRSAVTSVLYSEHHDSVLYSTSRDCTMRLWTTNGNGTGYQCGAIYRGHNHPIWCVAESSNNLYVATGSKDATARLWVTEREFPVQVFAGHKLDIDAIDFHPNGNYLASASDDLTIRLWCVTSGKLVRVFTNCKQPVKDIKFSPCGQYLAAVGLESKMRIYDLAAGQQLMEMKNVSGGMESVAWSSNSETLAAATTNGGGNVRLYSLVPAVSDGYRKRTYVTGCKRILRVVPNKKNSYTCIGINS